MTVMVADPLVLVEIGNARLRRGRLGLAEAAKPVQRPYVEASPAVPRDREPYEAPIGQMAELVEQVVAVEGPVHVDEVVARLRMA